jgi:hypothetical protein
MRYEVVDTAAVIHLDPHEGRVLENGECEYDFFFPLDSFMEAELRNRIFKAKIIFANGISVSQYIDNRFCRMPAELRERLKIN